MLVDCHMKKLSLFLWHTIKINEPIRTLVSCVHFTGSESGRLFSESQSLLLFAYTQIIDFWSDNGQIDLIEFLFRFIRSSFQTEERCYYTAELKFRSTSSFYISRWLSSCTGYGISSHGQSSFLKAGSKWATSISHIFQNPIQNQSYAACQASR